MTSRPRPQQPAAERRIGRAGRQEQKIELHVVAVIVPAVEAPPLRTQRNRERIRDCQQPIGLQRVHGESTMIFQLAGGHAWLVQCAGSVALELAAREHDAAPQFGTRLVVEPQPVIFVAIIGLSLLLEIRVVQVGVIVEAQDAAGNPQAIRELVSEPRIRIRVVRATVFVAQRVQQQIQVAAPRGQQPLPATGSERVRDPARRIEKTQREFALGRIRRGQRLDLDDPAHSIAEGRRKGARVDLDAVDDARVYGAEDVLEILEVERVEQTQPVEADERFVHLAATDVRLGGEITRRRARQPGHGAQRVVADVRQRLEVGCRKLDRDRKLQSQSITTGRDDHFFEVGGAGRHVDS